ncbi:MAG: hypothetical protein NT062_16535 [Proteobacteria bacterium]|nr:hypothetical protein [Pseudomonadota bacterium]
MRATSVALPLLLLAAACGDDSAAKVDGGLDLDAAVVDGMPDGTPADNLVATGLCVDAACTQITPGVFAYAPQFTLWSDGATKRRWFQLPPGTKIDTSNMDYWKFPIGTKLWKEFTRDGVRVETRFMEKLSDEATGTPPSWFYISYQWNLANTDTTPISQGAQNVNGTGHDIPGRALCRACHEGLRGPVNDRGRALGVGAISLDYTPTDASFMSLQKLVDMQLLTDPPAAPATTGAPFFPIGFDATERAAFGYLHANCGHCHNPTSATHDTVGMELRLETAKLTAATITPAYVTTVGVDAQRSYPALPPTASIVAPHDPASSVMIARMNNPDFAFHMPQAGSEIVDPTGQTVLTTWINALP